MPAGHYDPQTLRGNDSAANLLKSVQAQEVEFERLTKKLEAERESVGQKRRVYGVGSQGDSSMNSLNSMDESYQWQSPHPDTRLQDDTLGDSKMSSHLLDSCLRELDNRGTFGEPDMDYIQEDPYSGSGRPLYNDSYNQGYNPNYSDHRSPHASHTSLHSDRGRMGQRDNPNDNYTSYSSLARQPGLEDMRGSPGTPTRFNHAPYTSDYYNDNSPRYSMASNDSFQPRQQYHYDPR